MSMRLLAIGALMMICAAGSANLLQNPGFESAEGEGGSIPHWSANDAAAQQKVWADDADPRAGEQCLAVRSLLDTEPTRSIVSQRVPVEPNTDYALTLWAKRDSFVYGTRFEVGLLKDGEQVGQQQKQVRSVTWVPVVMTFNSEDATEAEVRITTPNKGDWRITVGRTLYVDDVSLVRVSNEHDLTIAGAGTQATADVDVAQAGAYYLWAKVRCAGPNTLTLSAAGRSWEFHAYTPGESYWVRPVLPELMLEAGRQTIAVTGEGAQIERVILTMDPFWQPEGAREFVPPAEAKAALLEAGFAPVKSGSVELTVTGDGPPGKWGFTQGVPFARGVLGDASHVRMPDRACQADVLMRWPDGSVKWLLVSTRAEVGENLTLEYGEEIANTNQGGTRVMVTETADAIGVTNGFVSFEVPRDGSALLRNLHSKSDPEITSIIGLVNGS